MSQGFFWALASVFAMATHPANASPPETHSVAARQAGSAPLAVEPSTQPVVLTLPASSRVKRLEITSTGGQLTVRGTRKPGLTLRHHRTLGDAACACSMRARGEVATIVVAAPNQAPCQIDLQIDVPQQMGIDVHNEGGNLFVGGIKGEVRCNLARGSAVVGGHLTALQARLAQGSISAQGLAGDAEIQLTSGNAQIFCKNTPTATVTLEIERGNVVITTPAAQIDTNLNLEAGTLHSDLRQTSDAALHVRGHVARGNVSVRAEHHQAP